jgi:hypothetical protein
MSTKEFMGRPEHASKFDESVTYKKLVEVGRVGDASSFQVCGPLPLPYPRTHQPHMTHLPT